MKKIVSYPLSIIYYLLLGITLVTFDIIQRIALLFGYRPHKKSVDILNFFLLLNPRVLGTRFKVEDNCKVPINTPVLIVSNHQSMYEISLIIWHLRRYHPKFISKKSLGRGVPSVSYNLRKGGSILIDRKNKEESLEKMIDFTQYLMENKRGGVIFPEGTRSRDGSLKPFKIGGLNTLIPNMKGAYVIPISVSNSWKLQSGSPFPLALGVKVKMKIHDGILIGDEDPVELIHRLEKIIDKGIEKS